MSPVEAICVPASDVTFGDRVRGLIRNEHWDLQSPEGIGLMQALLRGSYPNATVLPRAMGHPEVPAAPLMLEVVRDGGRTGTEIAAAWLSLVRERNDADLQDLASRIVADPRDVADVVDRAFHSVAARTSPSIDAESVGPALRVAVVRFAISAMRTRSTTRRVMPNEALEHWRVAERHLAVAGEDELEAARSDVDRLRAAYHVSIARQNR
jgi:hypothetical protein